MNELIAYLLLGVATNIDNMIIGTTYGLKRRRINFVNNLMIGSLNAAATFVSVLAGDFLRRFLSEQIGELLGGLVFLTLGFLTIAETYMMDREEAEEEVELNPKSTLVPVPRREALGLGLGLSVTNIAGGVGAGLAGFEAVRMTILMFTFSILPISLGQWLGQNMGSIFPQRWANITAATVLTGFGIWKLMSGVMSS